MAMGKKKPIGFNSICGGQNNNVSKIKFVPVEKSADGLDYVKIVMMAKAMAFTDDGNIQRKLVQVERDYIVAPDLDLQKIRAFCSSYCTYAWRIMTNENEQFATKPVAHIKVFPIESAENPQVLNKETFIDLIQGQVTDYCYAFNRTMPTRRKLHNKFSFASQNPDSERKM